MNQVIDLNCDLGETHPTLPHNQDEMIMPFITSCNIACGYHAGSEDQIRKTVDLAIDHNVAIGAHPSYDDWDNFGRKSVTIAIEKLKGQVAEQVTLVKSIAEAKGSQLHHVKPHGALYHDMADDLKFASSILEIIKEVDPSLIIYGLAGSAMITAAANLNLTCFAEAFSDRAYDSPTTLRPRSLDGAVLSDMTAVIEQVDILLSQQIKTYDGILHSSSIDTICLHSDTPGAVRLASEIHHHITTSDVRLYQA